MSSSTSASTAMTSGALSSSTTLPQPVAPAPVNSEGIANAPPLSNPEGTPVTRTVSSESQIPPLNLPENNAAVIPPEILAATTTSAPDALTNGTSASITTSGIIPPDQRPADPLTEIRNIVSMILDHNRAISARQDNLERTVQLGSLGRINPPPRASDPITTRQIGSMYPPMTVAASGLADINLPPSRMMGSADNPSHGSPFGSPVFTPSSIPVAEARNPLADSQGIPEHTSGPSNESGSGAPHGSESLRRYCENTTAEILRMKSQIHTALSSAPEIARVIDEVNQTPFTARIASPQLGDIGNIRLPRYNGETDPKAFLRSFLFAFSRVRLLGVDHEVARCRLLAESLIDSALDWFTSLKPNSIDSFAQLQAAFLKQYSVFIQVETSEADLWALKQKPGESLRKYIDSFKAIKARVASLHGPTALKALHLGLLKTSKFFEELTVRPPASLDDALHRSSRWIILEEAAESELEKANPASSSRSAPKANPQGPKRPGKREPQGHKSTEGVHSYAV